MYGSFANSLHLPVSDIDLVVCDQPEENGIVETLMIIKANLSELNIVKEFNEIYSAAMPLLRLHVEKGGHNLHIDITV